MECFKTIFSKFGERWYEYKSLSGIILKLLKFAQNVSIFCEQNSLLNEYNYFNSQAIRSGNYSCLFRNPSFDGIFASDVFLSVQAMSDINSFQPNTKQKEFLYCLITGSNNLNYTYLITYKVPENKLYYYQKYPIFSLSWGNGYMYVNFNTSSNDICFSDQYNYFLDITYKPSWN